MLVYPPLAWYALPSSESQKLTAARQFIKSNESTHDNFMAFWHLGNFDIKRSNERLNDGTRDAHRLSHANAIGDALEWHLQGRSSALDFESSRIESGDGQMSASNASIKVTFAHVDMSVIPLPINTLARFRVGSPASRASVFWSIISLAKIGR